MGLDMYLHSRKVYSDTTNVGLLIASFYEEKYPDEPGMYLSGWDYRPRDHGFDELADLVGEPSEDAPSFEILRLPDGSFRVDKMVFYWRKVWTMHNWFVENIQNGVDECEPHELDSETLAGAVGWVDGALADRALEWSEGRDRMTRTSEGLKRVLLDPQNRNCTFVYCSSW